MIPLPVIDMCLVFLSALNTVQTQIKGPLVAFIIDNETNSDVLHCFLSRISKFQPVIIQNMDQSNWGWRTGNFLVRKKYSDTNLKKPTSNILFLGNGTWEDLMRIDLWNPVGNVLTVSMNLYTMENNFDHFFRWRYPGITSLVLENLKFYTYFPYTNNTNLKILPILDESNIFPDKFPAKFGGYEISILSQSLVPLVSDDKNGIEQKLIDTVSDYLDLNKKYNIYADNKIDQQFMMYGSSGLSSTPEWVFAVMSNQGADVLMGNMQYIWVNGQYLDMGTPYLATSLAWYVPSPTPMKRAYAILFCFDKRTWAEFALAVLGVLFLFSVDLSRYRKFNYLAFFETVAVFAYQATSINRSSIKLYSIFLFCAYFYINCMSTAYQAALIKLCTVVPREVIYNDMADIAKSNLNIVIQDANEAIFDNSSNDVISSIVNRDNITYINAIWPRIVADGNYALLGPRILNDLALNFEPNNSNTRPDAFEPNIPLFDEHGQPKISILSDSIITYPLVIYFAPDFALTPIINEVTQRIVEAGLPLNWLNRFYYTNRDLLKWNRVILKRPLDFTSVGFMFFFWAVFLGCAVVAYIVELFVYYLCKYGFSRAAKVSGFYGISIKVE